MTHQFVGNYTLYAQLTRVQNEIALLLQHPLRTTNRHSDNMELTEYLRKSEKLLGEVREQMEKNQNF